MTDFSFLMKFLSEKMILKLQERGKEWLDIRRLKKEYKETLKGIFEKPLPLDKDLGVTLKEVYTDHKQIKGIFSDKILKYHRVSDFIWEEWENNKNKFILLLGQPGGGKSSLIKKLAYDWAENNTEPYPKKIFERNLYVIQLRYLPREFKESPVEVLTRYLKGDYDPPYDPYLWDNEIVYLFEGYKNSIIFLDGLDEFVMNYSLTEQDTKNLLERIVEGLKKDDSIVLITSRSNYLSVESLEEIKQRLDFAIWELQPFGYEEIEEFLEKYKKILKEKGNQAKRRNSTVSEIYFENFSVLKNNLQNDLSISNQPLLLYMISYLYLRENETPEIKIMWNSMKRLLLL